MAPKAFEYPAVIMEEVALPMDKHYETLGSIQALDMAIAESNFFAKVMDKEQVFKLHSYSYIPRVIKARLFELQGGEISLPNEGLDLARTRGSYLDP